MQRFFPPPPPRSCAPLARAACVALSRPCPEGSAHPTQPGIYRQERNPQPSTWEMLPPPRGATPPDKNRRPLPSTPINQHSSRGRRAVVPHTHTPAMTDDGHADGTDRHAGRRHPTPLGFFASVASSGRGLYLQGFVKSYSVARPASQHLAPQAPDGRGRACTAARGRRAALARRPLEMPVAPCNPGERRLAVRRRAQLA